MSRRVRIQGTLPRRLGNAPQLFRAAFERIDHILGTTRHQKVSPALEELNRQRTQRELHPLK